MVNGHADPGIMMAQWKIYIISDKVNNLSAVRLITFQS